MSYNEFISQSDDDLFESTSKPVRQETSAPTEELLKGIEELLSKDSQQNYVSHLHLQSRLINSINDSANRYVHMNENAFERSIFDQLNLLTNGAFAYRVYADVLEESIIKRMVVFDFLKIVASLDEEFKNVLNDDLKKIFNEHMIRTYIVSMQELLDYAIRYQIDVYKAVCQKIERTPQKFVVDRDIESVDLNILNYENYLSKYFSILRLEMGFEF